MKKTLLTSLFCAAMVLSSITFTKNSEQKVVGQTNNVSVAAPKMQRQNAYIAQTAGKTSVNEAAAIEQESNIQISDKGFITDVGPIEKVSSAVVEKSKPIGNYNMYSDKGVGDDVRNGATPVKEDNVCITGRIDKHSWIDQIANLIPETDVDWYKFSITENFRYDFNFTAPNSGYVFTLYKYRGEYAEGTGWNAVPVQSPIEETEHPNKEIFALHGNSSRSLLLNPGTYYLMVTVDNGKNIVSDSYNIIFEKTDYSGRNKSITLTEEVKASNVMALWENDLKPDNVNTWLAGEQQLRKWQEIQSPSIHLFREYGYVDPIYEGRRYLDSVLYIWNKDILKDLYTILSEVQSAIYNAVQEFRNQYHEVKKVYVWYEPWVGFGIDVLLEGAGYIPNYYVQAALSVYNLSESLKEALAYSANFVIQNTDDILNENLFGAGGFFQGVRDAVNQIKAIEQYDPNVQLVVCLPRYASIKKRTITEFGKPDTEETYFIPSFDGLDTDYMPHYFFDSDTISATQTTHMGYKTQTYHGKVSLFKNGKEFVNYTGLDYEQYINYYDPSFNANIEVIENDQTFYEKQLILKASNDYTNEAFVMFKQSCQIMLFTRGTHNTHISIYDTYGNQLKRMGSGCVYNGNAFGMFNVEAFKRYRVVVDSTDNVTSYGYLNILQRPNSYGYYGDIISNIIDVEEGILRIEGAGLEAFLGLEQGKAALYMFVPQFDAEYILSTYYSEEHYTYFIPMCYVSYNSFTCFGKGRQDAHIWLNAGQPCLVVVARKDLFAPLGNNNYFGLMIDVLSTSSPD